MDDKTSLIDFPCNFPIKIIGKKTPAFADEIREITRKHFPDIKDTSIISQESQNGNYLSLTITPYVQDQESLDALYRELTKHPDIKMVL